MAVFASNESTTAVAEDAQSLAVDADLVLDFTDDREVMLHVVTPQGNREVGTFDHVRDAWAAVDRIDLDGLEKLLAADRAAVATREGRRAT